MSLPPFLLERLKRRKIIQQLPEDDDTSHHSVQKSSPKLEETSVGSRYQEHFDDPIRGKAVEKDQELEEIIAEDYSGDEAEDQGDSDEKEVERDEVEEADEESDEQELRGAQEEATCALKLNPDTADDGYGEEQTGRSSPKPNVDAQRADDDFNKTASSCLSMESVIGCPNKYNIYHDCNQYCQDNYSNPEDTAPTIEQRKQLALVLRNCPMSNEWTVVYDPGVKTFYFWNIISNLVSWFPPDMNGFVSLPADQIRRTMREMEQ